jgi:hypothetical protein
MLVTDEHAADIVRRHMPEGWRLSETKRRTVSRSGCADPNGNVISTPYLRDAESIYIFLHECAHVHLGHFRGKGRVGHVEEYEAERMALLVSRFEGLRISRAVARHAKDYVLAHIRRDEAAGIEISPRVRKWADT